jgi:hypothetical protein
MQIHPTILGFLADDHFEQLQRDARRIHAEEHPRPAVVAPDVQLRLCTVDDDAALAELAELAERRLPDGQLVLAVVRGRIVAALPLNGEKAIADPFVRTVHIVPLLELRAKQLRESTPKRWWFVPRYANLMRGSTHA